MASLKCLKIVPYSYLLIPTSRLEPYILKPVASFKTYVFSSKDWTLKTVQPLKVFNEKNTVRTRQCELGPRSASNSNRRSNKQREVRKGNHRSHHPFELEEYDQMESTIGKYVSKAQAILAEEEQARRTIREMKSRRAATIRNKFFKPPKAPNLLFWSAKEQIRFLHQQDPEQWSIETLAASFPVDELSIKKILKSKVRLHREADIIQHDMNVLANWSQIHLALENEESYPYADSVFKGMRNRDNEFVIRNANGIKSLPFPPKSKKPHKATGPFTEIVKDCYEADKKADTESRDLSKKVDEILLDVSEDLSLIDGDNQEHSLPTSHFHESGELSKQFCMKQESSSENKYKRMLRKYKTKLSTNSDLNHTQENLGKLNPPGAIPLQKSDANKNDNDVYMHGDCIYDKNGEFLYRIP